ncbi:MAG TPA: D-TA family PLP-dependent enzyme [Pirellulales bacterium]|nr:D-TA family PLP-dependent enzyme [Pirellulales bacterium]
MPDRWYLLEDAERIASPALIVYIDRVRENLRRMIALAGGTERLRPHVKTHKMAEVIRMQMDAGINKFKCATIAEAEMLARAGAPDVMLAYPIVGPNVARLAGLTKACPKTRFSTLADDISAIRALSAVFAKREKPLEVLLDIDNGMHRSGVSPGPTATEQYRLLADLPGVTPGGLHVYDGHVREPQRDARIAHAEADFVPVDELRRSLESAGLPVPRVVAGGTPTFPVHARHADRECSPGTCVFWDVGYETKFPDLQFLHAALLLGRVVSKPTPDRLCIDLGYKAVSPDNPQPRVTLLDLPDAQPVVHSEEHLTVESSRAGEFAVGDVVYGVPYHICPTVALHREAVVIERGRVVAQWQVAARDRSISI